MLMLMFVLTSRLGSLASDVLGDTKSDQICKAKLDVFLAQRVAQNCAMHILFTFRDRRIILSLSSVRIPLNLTISDVLPNVS